MSKDDPVQNDKVLLEFHKQLLPGVLQRQFEYGKWLLASLLAVHLGSLLVISQSGDLAPRLFQASGESLIYGVSAALMCGALGWLNFTFVAYAQAQTVIALMKERNYEPGRPLRWIVKGTLFGAPVLGVASLSLFIYSARQALDVLRSS